MNNATDICVVHMYVVHLNDVQYSAAYTLHTKLSTAQLQSNECA